jgi:uncharacterized protein involved in exopolysaccharide biosynthesis
MDEFQNEKELMDYLNVIWRKRWLIAVPTFLCAVIVGIWSFTLPPTWEINAIIQPGKFITETQTGQFTEVSVIEARQLAGQINQESYNSLIAAELNLNLRKFPKLNAENLKDTKLVKVSLKSGNVQAAKDILRSLFEIIKSDLDKKNDIEMKSIDAQIVNIENAIKTKNLDIQSNEIEKASLKRDITFCQNKLLISEERAKSILDEMKTAKTTIEDIEQQQKKALAEKKEGAEALGLLLYSEFLTKEKINQEDLRLEISEKEKNIRQFSSQTEKLQNEIENLKNTITLMNEKKARIDYTTLRREPTSSLDPVSPQKKKNVLIGGLLSLIAFTFLAFFIEYIQQKKSQRRE